MIIKRTSDPASSFHSSAITSQLVSKASLGLPAVSQRNTVNIRTMSGGGGAHTENSSDIKQTNKRKLEV